MLLGGFFIAGGAQSAWKASAGPGKGHCVCFSARILVQVDQVSDYEELPREKGDKSLKQVCVLLAWETITIS